jgi:hypothetical protein
MAARVSASTTESPRVDRRVTRVPPAALSTRAPWIALAALMVVGFVLIMHAGRETTFYLDDWPALFSRQDWTWLNLVRPHIDHLQLFPFLVLKTMWSTVGLHDYWVYRAVLAVLDLLTGLLLFLYGRRRIGPWPSLALAACLVLMAPSWFNLLYAFQINFVGAMAAGLGALLLLDRETRRSDIGACVLLLVAIGSNGVGLPIIFAVVIDLVLRRGSRRRLWVPGIPLALYALWRLEYGHYAPTHPNHETVWRALQEFPRWVFDALDDTAAAAVGFPLEYGAAIALAFIGLAAFALSRPGRLSSSPRLAALAALPLLFWLITAIGRVNEVATQPDENRFLYPGALFLMLLAIEAGRAYPMTRQVTVAVSVVLLFGAARSANDLEAAGDAYRGVSVPGKDAATALDIAGHLVPPNFSNADPNQGAGLIEAGPYLETVKRVGSSPGFTREELLRQSDDRKRGVDQALVRIHRMGVIPVPDSAPTSDVAPRVTFQTEGAVSAAGPGCLRWAPKTPDKSSMTVEMPWSGIIVRAGKQPVDVRVHRFSTLVPGDPLGTAQPETTASVKPTAPDKAPELFKANLFSAGAFAVCASP